MVEQLLARIERRPNWENANATELRRLYPTGESLHGVADLYACAWRGWQPACGCGATRGNVYVTQGDAVQELRKDHTNCDQPRLREVLVRPDLDPVPLAEWW